MYFAREARLNALLIRLKNQGITYQDFKLRLSKLEELIDDRIYSTFNKGGQYTTITYEELDFPDLHLSETGQELFHNLRKNGYEIHIGISNLYIDWRNPNEQMEKRI